MERLSGSVPMDAPAAPRSPLGRFLGPVLGISTAMGASAAPIATETAVAVVAPMVLTGAALNNTFAGMVVIGTSGAVALGCGPDNSQDGCEFPYEPVNGKCLEICKTANGECGVDEKTGELGGVFCVSMEQACNDEINDDRICSVYRDRSPVQCDQVSPQGPQGEAGPQDPEGPQGEPGEPGGTSGAGGYDNGSGSTGTGGSTPGEIYNVGPCEVIIVAPYGSTATTVGWNFDTEAYEATINNAIDYYDSNGNPVPLAAHVIGIGFGNWDFNALATVVSTSGDGVFIGSGKGLTGSNYHVNDSSYVDWGNVNQAQFGIDHQTGGLAGGALSGDEGDPLNEDAPGQDIGHVSDFYRCDPTQPSTQYRVMTPGTEGGYSADDVIVVPSWNVNGQPAAGRPDQSGNSFVSSYTARNEDLRPLNAMIESTETGSQ